MYRNVIGCSAVSCEREIEGARAVEFASKAVRLLSAYSLFDLNISHSRGLLPLSHHSHHSIPFYYPCFLIG
jgi:PIN domain nuclease of toxin-antitoxin system